MKTRKTDPTPTTAPGLDPGGVESLEHRAALLELERTTLSTTVDRREREELRPARDRVADHESRLKWHGDSWTGRDATLSALATDRDTVENLESQQRADRERLAAIDQEWDSLTEQAQTIRQHHPIAVYRAQVASLDTEIADARTRVAELERRVADARSVLTRAYQERERHEQALADAVTIEAVTGTRSRISEAASIEADATALVENLTRQVSTARSALESLEQQREATTAATLRDYAAHLVAALDRGAMLGAFAAARLAGVAVDWRWWLQSLPEPNPGEIETATAAIRQQLETTLHE